MAVMMMIIMILIIIATVNIIIIIITASGSGKLLPFRGILIWILCLGCLECSEGLDTACCPPYTGTLSPTRMPSEKSYGLLPTLPRSFYAGKASLVAPAHCLSLLSLSWQFRDMLSAWHRGCCWKLLKLSLKLSKSISLERLRGLWSPNMV